MAHKISWEEEEMAGLLCNGKYGGVIHARFWMYCFKCGEGLKLSKKTYIEKKKEIKKCED